MKDVLFRLIWKVAWAVVVIGLVVMTVNEALKKDGLFERLRDRIAEEVSRDDLWVDYRVPSQEASTTIPATWGVGSYDEFYRALNCSNQRGFDVARPATRGYTCRSEGKAAHPFSVFEYSGGTKLEVLNSRRLAACRKGREHGSAVVHVLAVQDAPGVFVYTLSERAVANSKLASMFETLNSRDCR